MSHVFSPLENITKLEAYTTTVNFNIDNFNQHVNVNLEGLKAKGERKYDLMKNLLKAYHVASDKELAQYIKNGLLRQRRRYHNIADDD